MKYSIIVPVFNRPDEVDELLESLTHQSEKTSKLSSLRMAHRLPARRCASDMST